jgi:type II secretory pathway component PulK
MSDHGRQIRRRGAAVVVLSLVLLVMVTATVVTTMRGQWARRKATEEYQSRRTLVAALDAAGSLPKDSLSKGIRLSLDDTKNVAAKNEHSISISLVEMEGATSKIVATERFGEKIGLVVTRDWTEQ